MLTTYETTTRSFCTKAKSKATNLFELLDWILHQKILIALFFTAMFNNFGRSAQPLALNLVDSAILRMVTKKNTTINVCFRANRIYHIPLIKKFTKIFRPSKMKSM